VTSWISHDRGNFKLGACEHGCIKNRAERSFLRTSFLWTPIVKTQSRSTIQQIRDTLSRVFV